MKKLFLLITLFNFAFKISFAQPVKLDPSFGNGGIVASDIGAHYDYNSEGRRVLLAPDKSLYIIFNRTFISKRLADGAIDSSYGLNGYSGTIPLYCECAAVQADGKIVIVGSGYNNGEFFAVARINTNGKLDSSFGNNGVRIIGFYPTSVAIQGDGKMIVTGRGQGFIVSRYNSDGSADLSFNKTGVLTTVFISKVGPDTKGSDDSTIVYSGASSTVAIQANGKIVVGGSAYTTAKPDNTSFAIARYNTDGSADSTFSGDGKQTIQIDLEYDDNVSSIAIQNDSKIVLTGGSDNHFAVMRCKADGTPDSSFNGNGIQTIDPGAAARASNSVALQSDGKIVVAGYSIGIGGHDFAVARFNVNGSVDSTFNKDGVSITDFNSSDDYAGSMVIQNDNRIVVMGTTNENYTGEHFAVARYNTDGNPDTTFDKDGKLAGDYKQGRTEFNSGAVQQDGKIVAACQTWNGNNFDFAVARYNANGSPDNTFNNSGIQITDFGGDEWQPNILIQKNGKILLAGYSILNGSEVANICRYNPDGALDTTFNRNGKIITTYGFSSEGANAIALQSDGKVLVAGDYVIARYNINGSIDRTFALNGIQTTTQLPVFVRCQALAVQNDGKIVVAGFTTDDAVIIRLNPGGSFDNTFGDGGVKSLDFGLPDEVANSIAIQDDGKIVIGGGGRGSEELSLIARYNINGNPDSTFNGNGKQITHKGYITSMAIQSNGKIIAAAKLNDNSMALIRFDANGNIDNTFGDNGAKTTGIKGSYGGIGNICIGNDKIYAVGSGSFPGYIGLVERFIPGENQAPKVNITAPANNATYIAPANITINATAGDPDGTIASVQFYNGSTLLKEDSTAPYSYTIDNATPGTYSFVARAIDNNGLKSSSATVSVNIFASPGKSPVINITSPVANTTYVAPANITLNATANDPDGTVKTVQFYSGSTLLATDSTAPYSFTMSNVPAGTYTFFAKATDSTGLTNSSADVATFVVPGPTNKAPVVSLTTPTNNVTYPAPASITLSATASDTDGTIANVKFYNGSTFLKTISRSPYTYTINNLPAGNYFFYAKATDNKGLANSSATVSVLVAPGVPGKAPVVNLTSPTNNVTYAAPAAITLSATASDPDGTIANVKFYNGSTFLKTISKSPYTYTINNLPAGNYSFYAKATDNKGITNLSGTVSVFVMPAAANKAPVVTLTSPVNNASYIAPGPITVSAKATDPGGSITSVQFYNGATLLKSDSTSPYSYTIDSVAAGKYSFVAEATDSNGLKINSATAAVTVFAAPNKAPVVNLIDPVSNITYTAPATITLTATASDPDGTITKVKFYNGSTFLKTISKSPYVFTIHNAAAGAYEFFAKATDNHGLTNLSAGVYVVVTPEQSNEQSAGTAIRTSVINSKLSGEDTKAITGGAVRIKLAPNPVHDILKIYTTGLEVNKKRTISVISASGIMIKTIQTTSSAKAIQLNVSTLASGVYIVKMVSAGGVTYTQFVKL